jgi:hypothetical protein
VLRKIFGLKRDEVTGDWRKLYHELQDLYSPTIERVMKSKMRKAGPVATIGEGRGVYRVLVEKPEEKKPMRRWEDNIRTDLLEVGCGGMDWIGLAQDRDRCRALVNAVMNVRVR